VGFTDDLDDDIVKDAAAAYKAAATYLPFKSAQIKAAFSEDEIVQLDEFMTAMKASTAENERQKKILDYPSVVLKLLSLAKIV